MTLAGVAGVAGGKRKYSLRVDRPKYLDHSSSKEFCKQPPATPATPAQRIFADMPDHVRWYFPKSEPSSFHVPRPRHRVMIHTVDKST